MSLYKWDLELYNTVKKYFPKYLKNNKNKVYYTEITKVSEDVINMYIKNVDLYDSGIQLILNMGITEISHSVEKDIGIFPSPDLEGKHLRKYVSNPQGGQLDYYYPYKNRSLIFN